MPSFKKFLGKLGNVAQDTASFAVPAAATFGLSALSAGTLNPGTLALISSLGAGAKGFAGNEAEERLRKLQKRQAAENQRAQGTANLINSLNPRAGAQASPQEIATPKKGFLETVAGGVGQGVDIFNQAQLANSARTALATKQEAADLVLNTQKARNAAESLGADFVGPPNLSEGIDPELFNVARNKVVEADADRTLKRDILSREIELKEAASKRAQDDIDLRLKELKQEAEDRVKEAQAATELRLDGVADKERESLQRNNKPLQRLDEVAASYVQVQALVKDILDAPDAESRAMMRNTLIDIYQRGFVDVGVAVREDDVRRISRAQGTMDRIMRFVMNLKEGAALSDDQVQQIGQAATLLAQSYRDGIAGVIDDQTLLLVPKLGPDRVSFIKDFVLAPGKMIPITDQTGRGDPGLSDIGQKNLEDLFRPDAQVSLQSAPSLTQGQPLTFRQIQGLEPVGSLSDALTADPNKVRPPRRKLLEKFGGARGF